MVVSSFQNAEPPVAFVLVSVWVHFNSLITCTSMPVICRLMFVETRCKAVRRANAYTLSVSIFYEVANRGQHGVYGSGLLQGFWTQNWIVDIFNALWRRKL